MAGSNQEPQELLLDPQIRDWILFPIMVIMLLIGVLRHYVTQALNASSNQKTDLKQIRQHARAYVRAQLNKREWCRQYILKAKLYSSPAANLLPYNRFQMRKTALMNKLTDGSLLLAPPSQPSASSDVTQKQKDDDDQSQTPPLNPMGDPAQMEVMMEGMKKNMVMMVPQMIMMGWISYFFAGFIIVKLPFPLTVRFKAMLQKDIMTPNMDVAWVSSLSWYFLNLFGLNKIFSLILGDGSAAGGMGDMQAMANPMMMQQQQQQPGQVVDMKKVLAGEKESMELFHHQWDLAGVEERLLNNHFSKQQSPSNTKSLKEKKNL
ncbi:hypothetical protein MIR68_009911 [Amoeboaphelidium protococcarum]|nr:hypothetical protein MIR68_009911 [Amoeboaphelidium protococcarum]